MQIMTLKGGQSTLWTAAKRNRQFDDGDAARFMRALDKAIDLPKDQRLLFKQDFLQGYGRLAQGGVSAGEIARRLDPARLGDLYTEKPRTFYPLDNGAKQYPLVMRKGQMAMF
ncbi:MAG: hypothetical protein PHY64_11870, partial [Eubacteriales bacterium]|nr:hypothetical protein [Eubacteriales bacterium]